MPLKGIPFIISPELLTALYKAGHGDEIGITYLVYKPPSKIGSHTSHFSLREIKC